jgi:HemY protein
MLLSVLRILLFLFLAGLAASGVYTLVQSPDGMTLSLWDSQVRLAAIDMTLLLLLFAVPLIASLPLDNLLVSTARIAQFLILVVAAIWAIMRLIELPGGVTVTLAETELFFTPIAFTAALIAGFVIMWLALRLFGLLVAVLRVLFGDETALSRFLDRSRERRGLEAMARGMAALAAGDAKRASKAAKKAESLLQRPELTRLLNAQASELAGQTSRARDYYLALANEPETAFVGVRGLLNQALAEDDSERALQLAERAAELRPREASVLETLYMLQSRGFDWPAARRTLDAQRRAGLLPKPEANRRDAMLALAQADDAEEAGETDGARKLALEAVRLDPENAEAAATAARLQVAGGSKRAATKLLIDAWRRNPAPQIAAAFAAIEPDESAHDRRQRFGKLLQAHPMHDETRMLAAELALVTEDWAGARKSIEGLTETEQTARSCAIWAAIARGEGRPEAEVRGWLARALGAPRGSEAESDINHAAMLSLLIGEDAKTDVEDAEEVARDSAENDGRTAA